MKKVLFITNYPAPYRVRFFDELGKYMDVTVLFSDRVEEKKHRSAQWFESGEGHFRVQQLQKRVFSRHGRDLCTDVVSWIKQDFDHIVVCGYSNPTVIYAMAYMRLHRIPFYMEVDGGLIREEAGYKRLAKSKLVGAADRWISSGSYTTKYLLHYGAREEDIHFYPFSSLWERDIPEAAVSAEEKAALRRELGISEGKMVLTIGQFIRRKGFDVLLRSAEMLEEDIGIYIVGGEPTEEYLQLCRELGLKNVHFLGFMKKEELVRHYKAADLFVLPTREDIWGLVINEAMAYGLPVITTDRCVAGLELVEDGVNGYIIGVEDEAALAEKIGACFASDYRAMGEKSLEKVRPYTIENMVRAHMKIFEEN